MTRAGARRDHQRPGSGRTPTFMKKLRQAAKERFQHTSEGFGRLPGCRGMLAQDWYVFVHFGAVYTNVSGGDIL